MHNSEIQTRECFLFPQYAGIEYTLGLGLFIADTFGYLSSKNAGNNFETGGPTESTADKVKKVLEGALTTEERKQDLYEKSQEYLDNEEQRKEYEQKAKEILDWAPAYIDAQLINPNSIVFSIPSIRRYRIHSRCWIIYS